MRALLDFLQNIMTLAKYIGSKLMPIIRWYKRLWVKITYNKYDEFVYKRGIMMLIGTALTPFVLYFILLLGYYFSTHKTETVYLNHSEEIYPDDNIWGVRGCHSQFCDSESSLYFRIKPSLFHHAWNLINHGNIFLPDTLGSSVPTGLTKCEVETYGVRMRMTMYFNIYPNILYINCSENISTTTQ